MTNSDVKTHQENIDKIRQKKAKEFEGLIKSENVIKKKNEAFIQEIKKKYPKKNLDEIDYYEIEAQVRILKDQ